MTRFGEKPKNPLTMDDVFSYGRYATRLVADVVYEDPEYIRKAIKKTQWVFSEDIINLIEDHIKYETATTKK